MCSIARARLGVRLVGGPDWVVGRSNEELLRDDKEKGARPGAPNDSEVDPADYRAAEQTVPRERG